MVTETLRQTGEDKVEISLASEGRRGKALASVGEGVGLINQRVDFRGTREANLNVDRVVTGGFAVLADPVKA